MNKLKSLSAFVLCMAFILSFTVIAGGEENNMVDTKTAKSAVLTECTTGQVIFESNAHEKLPMASVTKLMCLLIWAEEMEKGTFDFNTVVTCTAHANSMDGSVIWLETGEQLTAGELIKSVVIASANDACVALCEHICGSEERFVIRMNERAKQLGMSNTSYKNCVGYDCDNHYTTAYDTALLCAKLSEYDIYNEFFATRLDYVRQGERQTQLLNTNKMVNYYEGIIGGKTGTTDNAGACLAVWARRGDMKLCAVELGSRESEERFEICGNLLDYGFNGFELFKAQADSSRLVPVAVTEGIDKQVDVRVKRLHTCVIPKGVSDRVEYEYTIRETAEAPVYCGQPLGRVIATLNGEEIFSSDIVAVRSVEKLSFFKSLLIILQKIFSM